jgi:hypothetical protein
MIPYTACLVLEHLLNKYTVDESYKTNYSISSLSDSIYIKMCEEVKEIIIRQIKIANTIRPYIPNSKFNNTIAWDLFILEYHLRETVKDCNYKNGTLSWKLNNIKYTKEVELYINAQLINELISCAFLRFGYRIYETPGLGIWIKPLFSKPYFYDILGACPCLDYTHNNLCDHIKLLQFYKTNKHHFY